MLCCCSYMTDRSVTRHDELQVTSSMSERNQNLAAAAMSNPGRLDVLSGDLSSNGNLNPVTGNANDCGTKSVKRKAASDNVVYVFFRRSSLKKLATSGNREALIRDNGITAVQSSENDKLAKLDRIDELIKLPPSSVSYGKNEQGVKTDVLHSDASGIVAPSLDSVNAIQTNSEAGCNQCDQSRIENSNTQCDQSHVENQHTQCDQSHIENQSTQCDQSHIENQRTQCDQPHIQNQSTQCNQPHTQNQNSEYDPHTESKNPECDQPHTEKKNSACDQSHVDNKQPECDQLLVENKSPECDQNSNLEENEAEEEHLDSTIHASESAVSDNTLVDKSLSISEDNTTNIEDIGEGSRESSDTPGHESVSAVLTGTLSTSEDQSRVVEDGESPVQMTENLATLADNVAQNNNVEYVIEAPTEEGSDDLDLKNTITTELPDDILNQQYHDNMECNLGETWKDEDLTKEDDYDVRSAVSTLAVPASEQILEAGVVSESRSLQSDDMYNGPDELCSPKSEGAVCMPTPEHSKQSSSGRGHSSHHDMDFDSYTSHYSNYQLQHSHASISHPDTSYLRYLDIPKEQSSEEIFQDQYDHSSWLSACHELQRFNNVVSYQASSDISRGYYTDGSLTYDQQLQTSHHPMALETGQQTVSDASKEFCSSTKQAPQSSGIKLRIKLPKVEHTNNSAVSPVREEMEHRVISAPRRQLTVKELPTTAKALLQSGLLEGCRVYYQYRGSGIMLTGVVKDGGILCDCRTCKGKTIVNVSSFEKHAGSNARHPSDYIFLENGKSLQEIIKTGWETGQVKYLGTARKTSETTEEDYEGGRRRHATGRGAGVNRKKISASNAGVGSSQRKSDPVPKATQISQSTQSRDGSRHKLLFLPGGLPDGAEVAYYVKGQRFLTGKKMGQGICCGCCNDVISCSQFEAHAGWASRRNAYISIYLSNGQSLHEFALTLAAKNQTSVVHNDYCGECGDGGDLLLCGSCPKAYHAECVGLFDVSTDGWCCSVCENQKSHPWKKTAKGNSRAYCLSNREKVSQRCQRVIKAPENTIGGCVFCKNGDFLKSGFGEKTIMLCDQCEREYHVGCMREHGIADLQELPAGEWFCSAECNHIHDVLEGLVSSGSKLVNYEAFISISRRDCSNQIMHEAFDVSWQLLHGRRGDPENGRTLSEAASIFTESFDPIIDAASGRDLISLMVYSRSIRDQDFRGMYCAVLKWKDRVVSAAVIRIFGRQFAELPLVATASDFRGQGFFQVLMSNIEGLLRLLQVQYLVLPAAEEAEGIWKHKFGFLNLSNFQLQQFGSQVQLMIFQGSSMLYKGLL